MLSAITETLGYERVNISLVDWERSEIRTEYLTGLSEADAAEFKRLAAHPLSSRDIQADIVRSRQIEVPSVVGPASIQASSSTFTTSALSASLSR